MIPLSQPEQSWSHWGSTLRNQSLRHCEHLGTTFEAHTGCNQREAAGQEEVRQSSVVDRIIQQQVDPGSDRV